MHVYFRKAVLHCGWVWVRKFDTTHLQFYGLWQLQKRTPTVVQGLYFCFFPESEWEYRMLFVLDKKIMGFSGWLKEVEASPRLKEVRLFLDISQSFSVVSFLTPLYLISPHFVLGKKKASQKKPNSIIYQSTIPSRYSPHHAQHSLFSLNNEVC